MKLFAISDLHVGSKANREALATLEPHPEDWLVVAGDVGELFEHVDIAFRILTDRFARVFWVPGNHELWTIPGTTAISRGAEKYRLMVKLCRLHGILTPEDPYAVWPGDGTKAVIAPVFALYDYTFRPSDIDVDQVFDWAKEGGVVSADEAFLHTDPHPNIQRWCTHRCDWTEKRLAQASDDHPVVLVNHFPLRQDLLDLRRIERFAPWCGTKRTENWHTRFRVAVAVTGHLHRRRTLWVDGVRFEEVALGYPRDWEASRGVDAYLREILPGRNLQFPATGTSSEA